MHQIPATHRETLSSATYAEVIMLAEPRLTPVSGRRNITA